MIGKRTFGELMELVEETLILKDFADNLQDVGRKNIQRLQNYLTIFEELKPTNMENIRILQKTLTSCLSFVAQDKSFEEYRSIEKGYRTELENLEKLSNSPLAEMMYTSLINELKPILQQELTRRLKRNDLATKDLSIEKTNKGI